MPERANAVTSLLPHWQDLRAVCQRQRSQPDRERRHERHHQRDAQHHAHGHHRDDEEHDAQHGQRRDDARRAGEEQRAAAEPVGGGAEAMRWTSNSMFCH